MMSRPDLPEELTRFFDGMYELEVLSFTRGGIGIRGAPLRDATSWPFDGDRQS